MRTTKAFVYDGVGKKILENRSEPEIQKPGDAIVKMIKTTICGADLHIVKADVATCAPDRILGQDGVGMIEAVGADVTTFKAGDRVLVPPCA